MDETLVHVRHRVARLLEEEDRVARVDLVRGADALLDEREVAADEAPRRAPRAYRACDLTPELGARARRAEGGQERRHRRVAAARDEVVHRGPVEDAEPRATHEPEVQRRDV